MNDNMQKAVHLTWTICNNYPPGILGAIPSFFQEHDVPAAKQIAKWYVGGWYPMKGWKLHLSSETKSDWYASYPGDPPFRTMAVAKFNEELIILFESAWLAIVQPDGSFEISRVD